MRFNQLSKMVLLVAALVCGLAVSADQSGRSIEAQIQGRWEVVAGVNQGRELLPAEIAGTSVAITVNQIVTSDHEQNQRFRAVFVIDETKTPAQITMTSIPEDVVEKQLPTAKEPTNPVALGIVKIVSPNQWMLCYALPGAEPPTTFESTAGSKLMSFTMERNLSEPVLDKTVQ